MSMTVNLLSPIGAEIIDADADLLLSDERVPSLVMDALEQNGVVAFRELGLDDAQQVAFAQRLGEIVRTGKAGHSGDFPEIYHVGFGPDLNNELYVKGAFFWHLDGSTDETPTKASLLSGRALAATGGDTQFVSTYAAYDRLSDEEKTRFASLRVLHSAESAYRHFDPDPAPGILERLRTVPTRTHPLVWTHRTGRKSLVLGTTASHVVGMADDESAELLANLLARATEAPYVYTHKWTLGDLVIWDNRGTLHRATPYAEDSGRRMHRVTLVGDEPIQ